MAFGIHQIAPVLRALPSGSGRACRVLCPILVIAGCAADSGTEERVCGAPETVRIVTAMVPANNASARDTAIDLDGDDLVENQAGMVTGTLSGQLGIDFSDPATARLASDVTWYLAIRDCGAGEVALSLAPTDDAGALVHLTGTRSGDRIVARGHDGAMPVSTMFDPVGTHASAGWLRALTSAIDMQELPDGGWEGRVAMALPHAPMVDAVTRPLQPYFDEHGLFLDYFDADHDGRITLEELQQASVTTSLLAPDLRIGGEDALSFAIRFAARAN